MRKDFNNLIGKKFDRLTILEIIRIPNNNKIKPYEVPYAICSCDCGNNKTEPIRLSNIQQNKKRSCGCLLNETRKDRSKKAVKYEPRESSAREVWNKNYTDGNLTFESFFELSQKNCFYCDAAPSNSRNIFKKTNGSSQYAIDNGEFIYNGLDRVDSNMPHNENNCVPCCRHCNTAKWNRSITDFAQWILNANEWASKFMETQTNQNCWVQTYTGKKFYPLSPAKNMVDIRDIAHALSLTCRFRGHCNSFYSVAQHSVLVSKFCNPENALFGLLHDSSEAYLSDLASPLKKSGKLEVFRYYENQLQSVIYDKYCGHEVEPPDVKIADLKTLATEVRDLMKYNPEFKLDYEPYEEKIISLSPSEAEALFLHRFKELIGETKFKTFTEEQ